jgi:hypothetical protein
MVPLDPMMDLSGYPYTTAGRSVLTLPVQGTATVIQKDRRIAGPYMDGHEVMFNDFTARKQVTAFLKSLLLGSGSPVVVQAMTEVYAGSEGPITCSHAPNVVGAPLADSCDCSVAMVCSDPAHNFCCRSEWSQSCVDYYHSRLPAINSDSTCNYLCASGTCNYGG